MRYTRLLLSALLLTSLGTSAALAAEFQGGQYTLRSAKGEIVWQLLFTKGEGAVNFRVTGQGGDGSNAGQAYGVYSPGPNSLYMSMSPPEGQEGPHVIGYGGHWEAASDEFVVTAGNQPPSRLIRDKAGPAPGQPLITATLEAPSPQIAGTLAIAKVRIAVRGVSRPFELQVSAAFTDIERYAGSNPISFPVREDDVYEYDLAKFSPITVPYGVDLEELHVSVLPVGLSKPAQFLGKVIQIVAREAMVRPIDVQAQFSSKTPPQVGKPSSFFLIYKLAAKRFVDCRVIQRVSIVPAATPEVVIDIPVREFVAQAGNPGFSIPAERGQYSFEFPSDGRYRVNYRIEGDGMAPYDGAVIIDVDPADRPAGPGTAAREAASTKVKLQGDLDLETKKAKVGEGVEVAVSCVNTVADEDLKTTTVLRIWGPTGALVSQKTSPTTYRKGVKKERVFELKFDSPGEYTVELFVTGDRVEDFRREATITIEAEPKPATPAAPATGIPGAGASAPQGGDGKFGLIAKVIGKAAPSEVGRAGTWSGAQGESSFSASFAATDGSDITANFNMTWSSPPPVLTPGEIITLTCTASAAFGGTYKPPISGTATWSVGGACEVLEAKSAFAGVSGSTGQLHASGEGKYRVQIGRGGTITLTSSHPGLHWGSGGAWNPCIYTYQLNAKPIAPLAPPPPIRDPSTQEKPSAKDEGPGAASITSLTPDDPDERANIQAFLDPPEIKLFAGEPSKIVDVHISGYRRNTEDRVEVLFPQKTDNWASLPGQIVVGGGDGSYLPANMVTPEHVDGYFFSAKQTAQGGIFTVWIIVRQKGAGAVRIPLSVMVFGRPRSLAAPVGPVTSADGGSKPLALGATTGFAGDWDSTLGPLTLSANGNSVTGTYADGKGTIQGRVSGATLTLTYRNGEDRGTGEIKLGNDGASFAGFRLVPKDDGTAAQIVLTGRRALSRGGLQQPLAAGAVPSYEGAWQAAGGTIVINVRGSRVDGSLLKDDWKLAGKLEAGVLKFRFAGEESDGFGELTVSEDGKTLSGFYVESSESDQRHPLKATRKSR